MMFLKIIREMAGALWLFTLMWLASFIVQDGSMFFFIPALGALAAGAGGTAAAAGATAGALGSGLASGFGQSLGQAAVPQFSFGFGGKDFQGRVGFGGQSSQQQELMRQIMLTLSQIRQPRVDQVPREKLQLKSSGPEAVTPLNLSPQFLFGTGMPLNFDKPFSLGF